MIILLSFISVLLWPVWLDTMRWGGYLQNFEKGVSVDLNTQSANLHQVCRHIKYVISNAAPREHKGDMVTKRIDFAHLYNPISEMSEKITALEPNNRKVKFPSPSHLDPQLVGDASGDRWMLSRYWLLNYSSLHYITSTLRLHSRPGSSALGRQACAKETDWKSKYP